MTEFRALLTIIVAVFAGASAGYGQTTTAPDFIHGVDYSFERMVATRQTADEGQIRLVSYVYRPLRNDRHEVVLFSHGSTGGGVISAKEAVYNPPRSIIRFFTSRGYTVVAPMRRGAGESSGTSREECAYHAKQCTLAENRATVEAGLREAVLDTKAVLHQIVSGKLLPRNMKVVFSGVSRGGFLSLVMAGEDPEVTKGVLSFVGGLISISEEWPVEENRARLRLHQDRLTAAAARTTAPSFWVYAARDTFYPDSTTRKFFRAYTKAGGKAEYFYVPSHSLENGHLVATSLPLWEEAADTFLGSLNKPSKSAR
jgi:dienelactone hydrolase